MESLKENLKESVVKTEKEAFEDEIFRIVPTRYKEKAKNIFQFLKLQESFSWNSDGEIIYKNTVIPGSNIAFLVNDFLRNRKSAPEGRYVFLRALNDVNLPKHLDQEKNNSTRPPPAQPAPPASACKTTQLDHRLRSLLRLPPPAKQLNSTSTCAACSACAACKTTQLDLRLRSLLRLQNNSTRPPPAQPASACAACAAFCRRIGFSYLLTLHNIEYEKERIIIFKNREQPKNHTDLYFAGIYCIHERFRGLNVGTQLFAEVFARVQNKNILGNAVNAMLEKYIRAGDLPYTDENFITVKNYIPSYVTPNVLTNNDLPENIEIESYQENLLSSIAQYDATIAGFERKHILELSCKEKDSQTFVAFKNGTCIGYGSIKRSCLGAGRVGPLFADDPVVAEALLKKLLESFPDRKGFAMMTLRDNIIANSFIRKLGNPETGTCVRLYNKEKLKVDTNRIFALTDMNFSAF
ncbi:n-acetyltransferase domain-containing protein [Nephila pilipes]|uniref:N-acetyltransferase domain-containing protein n=1 Tax=Nephila pilipes TaxID=299642 RepID=A0A8X6TNE4_NEPPI|nr:n-acetyltransferase domain-containing protein [Nephila pilipes]